MENKALYIMAGYDDATENYLAGIQNRLYAQGLTGVHTKNIPQHITLCSYPVEQEGILKEKLRSIAAKTEAFEVSLSHVGIFDGGNVLLLHLIRTESLLSLKRFSVKLTVGCRTQRC